LTGHAGNRATGVRMPTITTNDIKNGMTLDLDEGLFQIVDFQHVKPGKGHAFVRTTLKNVRSGAVVDRTFRAGEKVERAIIDKKDMQLLYFDGESYVFMDGETYDQVPVAEATLAASVELTIAQTDPGLQGDRSTGGTKPATLETGLVVQVPLFVTTGERIKVDTRSGSYISRA
jgi:elongation factor P